MKYAKGSLLSARLHAGKNTRWVCAVKKHAGARSLGVRSFTKLIDANDALIVLRRRCRLAFYSESAEQAAAGSLENFGTSSEIQLELPE